jgi:hypothetical protein
MRNFLVVALALSMFGGIAAADRRGNGRGDRQDNRRPSVREYRGNPPPARTNRPARRADRRAINRNTVYATDGRFAFSNGRTRVYRQPVIRARYYNARVRPRLIVERYPVEPGYIWVRGAWTWSGSEWRWGGGHYAPDPQYSVYYDDGSYDYSSNFSVGVGIRIGN